MALLVVATLLASLAALAAGAKPEPVLVTCGSLIKLEHDRTKAYLHSHEVAYGAGRGSGQQSVTGYPERVSAGSMWIVRGADFHCVQGTPLRKGARLRLQHGATQRWLHSHLFASPLSNQQEVSAFGSDAESDTGDVWTLEFDDKAAAHWARDMSVRLKHVDTGAFLAAHDQKYQRPIPGHLEVFAAKSPAATTAWRATEGVYFPPRSDDDKE